MRTTLPGTWNDGTAEALVAEGLRTALGTAFRRFPVLGFLFVPSDLGDGTIPDEVWRRAADEFGGTYDWGRGDYYVPPARAITLGRSPASPLPDYSPVAIGRGLYGVRSQMGVVIGRAPTMDDLPTIQSQTIFSPWDAARRADAWRQHQGAVAASNAAAAKAAAERVRDAQATRDFQQAQADLASRNRQQMQDFLREKDARLAAASGNFAKAQAQQARERAAEQYREALILERVALEKLAVDAPVYIPEVNQGVSSAGLDALLARIAALKGANGYSLAISFNDRVARTDNARLAADRLAGFRSPSPQTKASGFGYVRALALINGSWGRVSEFLQASAAFQQALYIKHDDGTRSYLYGYRYDQRMGAQGSYDFESYLRAGELPGTQRDAKAGQRFRSFAQSVKGWLDGDLELDVPLFAYSIAKMAVMDAIVGQSAKGMNAAVLRNNPNRPVGASFGPFI